MYYTSYQEMRARHARTTRSARADKVGTAAAAGVGLPAEPGLGLTFVPPETASQPLVGVVSESVNPATQDSIEQTPPLHKYEATLAQLLVWQSVGVVQHGTADSQPLENKASQSKKPEVQVPTAQREEAHEYVATLVPVQAKPQLPQLAASEVRSTSQPVVRLASQLEKPALHERHPLVTL